MKFWRVDGDRVYRGNQAVAVISMRDGLWRWDGLTFTMYRQGFALRDGILEDVKYFWRYRDKPIVTVSYRNGRTVNYYLEEPQP